MELGPLEGSYLELLNSSADPLQLYHLYDRMDLTGEEEIELCSGGLPSLGPFQGPPSPLPPRGRAGRGAPLSTTDSSNCRPGSLLVGTSPSLPCLSLLPQQPPSQTFPASSKCLFLPEPDTDTINCEQFSRLLCDMEGDEETREAYANIGEKAFLVQKKDN